MELSSPAEKEFPDVFLSVKGMRVLASVHVYSEGPDSASSSAFIRIKPSRPLFLKWGDRFDLLQRGSPRLLGKGKVLHPFSEKLGVSAKKEKRRVLFLKELSGDEKKMLFALIQEKGILGISEDEIHEVAPLSKKSLLSLSQELEADGKIKILSFSPLFLLSQSSFEFLCDKILSYLFRFHKLHPDSFGVTPEKIKKRFGLSSKILTLALKTLSRAGKIKEDEKNVILGEFERALSAEEEKILQQMEALCYRGELHAVSFKQLQERFHLTVQALDRLLSLLAEKNKVIQTKEGLLLHSKWVEEVILKLRTSGLKELSVADFKKMTGLTRKYAIPLLELLDQMGVTRRRGAKIREVL